MSVIDTRKKAYETFKNTVHEARLVRTETHRNAQHTFDVTCADALHKYDNTIQDSKSE